MEGHSSNPPPPPPSFIKRGDDFLKFGNKGGDKFFSGKGGVGILNFHKKEQYQNDFQFEFSKSFFKISKHKIRGPFLPVGTNIHILNHNIG